MPAPYSAFISKATHYFLSRTGTHLLKDRAFRLISPRTAKQTQFYRVRTTITATQIRNAASTPSPEVLQTPSPSVSEKVERRSSTTQEELFQAHSVSERDLANEPSIEEIRAIATEDKPGVRDDKTFPMSESVNFWRSLKKEATLDEIVSTLRTSSATSTSASLWTHALIRSGFFRTLNIGMGAIRSLSKTVPVSRNLKDLFSLMIIRETMFCLKDDIDRVDAKVYRPPWDATFRDRRYNPLYTVNEMLKVVPEARDMLSAIEEKRQAVWINKTSNKAASKQDIYPDYYLYGFHYQPHGWLSSQTADSYEILTETLFNGRQDSMQRLTFHSLQEAVRDEEGEDIVEIGAGTGRLTTFVRDNYRRSNLHVTDLSPFFLEKARENMQEWSKVSGVKDYLKNTHFIQAQAEKLPFEDASVDVVYSVYLFHELPPHARSAVFKEAARVLKKGGHFILTDSGQLGDRGERWDYQMGNFSNMNEPWYKSYIMTDFGELATKDDEFEPVRRDMCSATKTLMFKRL